MVKSGSQMSKEELAEMGRRWRKRRRELDITQQELAEKLNINQSSVSQFEKGRVEPKATVAIKAARILEVDLLWLMGLDDESE